MRRVAYNSQFAPESKLDRVKGGFCGILLNHLITSGSGGTAPLIKPSTTTSRGLVVNSSIKPHSALLCASTLIAVKLTISSSGTAYQTSSVDSNTFITILLCRHYSLRNRHGIIIQFALMMDLSL